MLACASRIHAWTHFVKDGNDKQVSFHMAYSLLCPRKQAFSPSHAQNTDLPYIAMAPMCSDFLKAPSNDKLFCRFWNSQNCDECSFCCLLLIGLLLLLTNFLASLIPVSVFGTQDHLMLIYFYSTLCYVLVGLNNFISFCLIMLGVWSRLFWCLECFYIWCLKKSIFKWWLHYLLCCLLILKLYFRSLVVS